ncbi:MAG: GtrA family protein [Pseudomonadota bacterium]
MKPADGLVKLTRQAVSFGGVGVVGFIVDATVFTVSNVILQNLYWSRAVSYLAAVTTTWFLNRKLTFGASGRNVVHEWGRFAVTQLGGGAVNYGVYAWLVASFELFYRMPVAAIAVGSLAGMAANFAAAKFLVFNQRKD